MVALPVSGITGLLAFGLVTSGAKTLEGDHMTPEPMESRLQQVTTVSNHCIEPVFIFTGKPESEAEFLGLKWNSQSAHLYLESSYHIYI